MQIRGIHSIARWIKSCISMAGITLIFSYFGAWKTETAIASSRTCSMSNVAGSYGMSGSGTIVSNPFGLSEGPVVTVGVITFDDHGFWVSHRSANVGGQFINDIPNSGRYIVLPDCTFSFVDETNEAIKFVGVFVAGRDEGWFMATGEGVVTTYSMKRIQKKRVE